MRTIILFLSLSLAAIQVRSQQYGYIAFDSIHLKKLNILTGNSAFVVDIQAIQEFTDIYNNRPSLHSTLDTIAGSVNPNITSAQAEEPIYYWDAPSDTNQFSVVIQAGSYIAVPIGSTPDTLRAVVTFADGNGRTVSFYGPKVIPKLNAVNNIPIPPCIKAYTTPALPVIPISAVLINPPLAYLNSFKIVTVTLTD